MTNRKQRMGSNGQFYNIILEIIAGLKNKSEPKAKVIWGGEGVELAEMLLCLCLFLDQEKGRKQKVSSELITIDKNFHRGLVNSKIYILSGD